MLSWHNKISCEIKEIDQQRSQEGIKLNHTEYKNQNQGTKALIMEYARQLHSKRMEDIIQFTLLIPQTIGENTQNKTPMAEQYDQARNICICGSELHMIG